MHITGYCAIMREIRMHSFSWHDKITKTYYSVEGRKKQNGDS